MRGYSQNVEAVRAMIFHALIAWGYARSTHIHHTITPSQYHDMAE
ncbi:MAG: hypothetical protein J07HQW1_01160 [Haloquadratum walsbyi J07HQW1]|jgi:hypothetical protein|uniref:Uncharacterized protein n=1 Tax=Haloquadratum walsbyi J07HQW1 TaxID=1238424 RepID=U1N409_9EURY|nr:MAG: hypothetical protein J07HQW1_01160 [Haloquadratum walsbyi J07HQW1]